MTLDDITVLSPETARGVLRVVLDRPLQRNAMTWPMVRSLFAVLESEAGRNAGAILLSGEGKGFCAGSDLKELASMSVRERSLFEADCGRLSRAIVAHSRPVVAEVSGFAIGGGLTLAAACDIVVTAPDAKWSLPEVPIGLFPAWGLGPVRLRTGPAFARRLSFGIDTFDGREAQEAGLADIVSDDPRPIAAETAEKLAQLPTEQVAAVKEYFASDPAGEEADRHANRLFAHASESEDAKRSFSRFAR